MSSFHNAAFPSFTEGSVNRGEGGGAQQDTQSDIRARCLQTRRVDATNTRQRDDARERVLVAGSNLNTKNKNMCGEGSGGSARRMIQHGAPLRPGGSVEGGFCLESTLSNPLQDADISRNEQRGSGGVEAATHPAVKSKQPGQGLQAAQGRAEQRPVSRLLRAA